MHDSFRVFSSRHLIHQREVKVLCEFLQLTTCEISSLSPWMDFLQEMDICNHLVSVKTNQSFNKEQEKLLIMKELFNIIFIQSGFVTHKLRFPVYEVAMHIQASDVWKWRVHGNNELDHMSTA